MKKNTRDNFISKLKNKNNRKLYIKVTSIALSIVLLVGTIIYFAFARYESTKDFSLINAKVGVYGDIVIAAVVDGQSQASFPDKSTYKLQNVECKDSNNNTITSMYDTNTWGMYIPEVNGKTKCTYTFTTNTVTEHSLNPTTATGDAYSGSSGNLNGSSTLTTSTPLNLSDYVQNNQYHFNLGGGEQITFPSGFYSSPINVSNGGTTNVEFTKISLNCSYDQTKIISSSQSLSQYKYVIINSSFQGVYTFTSATNCSILYQEKNSAKTPNGDKGGVSFMIIGNITGAINLQAPASGTGGCWAYGYGIK